ncbi:sigma-54-dependent Fis family transcriptional regulator [Treponema sp.]|uniref:sigma-54-dependent Fis family transcriptional regulator n=1 Tax=Treponema sp. TaxID=166 RepID=UPI003F12941C
MGEDGLVPYEKLKSLIEINTRINLNYADPDTLLVSILESAMFMVKCEAASLLLVQPEINSLEFYISLGPKNSEVKKILVERKSIAGWVADNCQSVLINDVNKDPRFNSTVQNTTKYVTRNMIAFPMSVQGNCVGVIELINKENNCDFTSDDLAILELLGEQAAVAYQNALRYRKNKVQLNALQNVFDAGKEYHPFIAKNPVVLSLLENIKRASSINSSVLITGESGVGKELFAEQIHLLSSRKDKPFVRVSCASLSPALLESEFFGHVKGAFTDAVSARKGRFELADGGTIFLDEIGELPVDLQAKLLRVIQEKKFERVGSCETISVDVRIIAATNRDLEAMITQGTFRTDLYFRLNVLPIAVPPLRERRDELGDLCEFFLNKFKAEIHKEFIGFSEAAKKAIYSYMWPGNIRELENTIERACIIGNPPFIQLNDLRLPVEVETSVSPEIHNCAQELSLGRDRSLKNALSEFKKQYVEAILRETNWNQTAAAKILGIQRTYVSKLISELNIHRP